MTGSVTALLVFGRGIDDLRRPCDQFDCVLWTKSCKFTVSQRKLWQPFDQMADQLLAAPFFEFVTRTDADQSGHEVIPLNADGQKWRGMFVG